MGKFNKAGYAGQMNAVIAGPETEKGCPRREDSLFCYGLWLGNQSSNRMFMISQAAFATLVPGPNTAATPA